MSFAYPIFLYAAALVFLLSLLGFAFFNAKKKAILANFVTLNLAKDLTKNFSHFKSRLKLFLFSAGIALIFVALARPQYGFVWEEEKTIGTDIIFALDTSKSMLVQDLKPDRLERSKLAINDLVEKLSGDRIGLIAFSGQAFLQCPITLDYSAFKLSLDALDTNIILRGGTNIAAAIIEAEAAFENSKNQKILVLISDGEELEASGIAQAKDAYEKKGIKIYTLGVGTANGLPIPIKDEKGNSTYLKDEKGEIIKSKLNDELLSKIASATGGFYASLAADGMEQIYQDGIAKEERSELESKMKKRPLERFQIPLLLAIILLSLESIIGTRKFFMRNNGAKFSVLALLVLPAFALPNKASAEDGTRSESTFWRDTFNAGVASLEAKDYKTAKENFYKTIAQSYDLKIHADAFYNAASADYLLAKEKEADILKSDETQKAFAANLLKAASAMQEATQTLDYGKNILEKNGEEALKKDEVQNRIKASVSNCEALKKSNEEDSKQLNEASDSLKKILPIINSAKKNFENSAELSENIKERKDAALAAKNAENKVLEKFKNIEKSKQESAKLEKLSKELIEELKKLLRDENKQNNQDQQNQDNKDKQDKSDKNQDNKENQKDQNSSDKNKDEQKKNQDQNKNEDDKSDKDQQNENQKDKEKPDTQNKEDKNKDEQATKPEDEKDKSAQDKQKEEAPAQDKKDQNETQKNETAAQPENQKEAAKETEQKASQDERSSEGVMTRREASQVLDTLKGSEKKLPFQGFGNQKNRYEDKNYKDW